MGLSSCPRLRLLTLSDRRLLPAPAIMTSTPPAQSVRFSDVHEEIEPSDAVQDVAHLTASANPPNHDAPLSPHAEEELRNLSSTLQKSRMQAKRMENFSFEPVSLPPSRVSKPAP